MTPYRLFADLPWWARAVWRLKLGWQRALATVAGGIAYGVLKLAQLVLAQFRWKLAFLALRDLIAFLITWFLIWLALWWAAPDLIVGTTVGASTLLQAIPTTIVAIYVLVLGSLFVVAQVLISSHGQRAALLLTEDELVPGVALRPLIIGVATLFLAGRVPARDPIGGSLSAGLGVLVLATGVTAANVARLLIALFLRYTAPLSVMRRCVADTEIYFQTGDTGLVRWRIPMLEEMGKLALRRGDSASFMASLQGLQTLTHRYAAIAPSFPAARGYTFDDDGIEQVTRLWFGDDLAAAIVRIVEDAFRSNAPSNDVDSAIDVLESAAHKAVDAGLGLDACRMMRGLIQLGTSVHQVQPTFINVLVRPAGCLARLEHHCEAVDQTYLAAYALAGWALLMSYFDGHIADPHQSMGSHPLWKPSIGNLGLAPPWDRAHAFIDDSTWRGTWANQVKVGFDFVHQHLIDAKEDHLAHQSGAAIQGHRRSTLEFISGTTGFSRS